MQAQIQRRILKAKYSFPKIVLFLFILLVLGGSLYFIIRNMDKIRDVAIKPENEFSLVTTFSRVGMPLFPNGILAVDPYKGMTFRASKRGSQILEGGIGNKKIRLESGFDKQKFSVTGFVNNRRVGLTIEQMNRDSYKISGMTINGPIDCTVSRSGSQWKISGNYADSGINLIIK